MKWLWRSIRNEQLNKVIPDFTGNLGFDCEEASHGLINADTWNEANGWQIHDNQISARGCRIDREIKHGGISPVKVEDPALLDQAIKEGYAREFGGR
jgi:hypothetical protein